ncbi:MAG: FG-GAP repeat protein [Leptolyngbya sp. SIO1E4]|nr:FG-GAP repeat protein [Leptolyngbya sp. SIO1E4]
MTFDPVLNLADLEDGNGFVINGIDIGDGSGGSVSSAGDINGDGIDDLIIGATGADPNGNSAAGESYVVFGSNQGFSDSLELSDLDGSNGFVLNGIDVYDFSGRSVSAAGDINGDGIDDFIIGSADADPNGNSRAGESYVVFGSDQGFSASLELSDLDGSNGFVINGIDTYDGSGGSVSAAGDINSDGIDDLIIGASNVNTYGAGASYVVFGSDQGFSDSLELSDLDGSNGFVINGINYDSSGGSVSSAGDINGDGIDDLIIGASGANGLAGGGYVVFGSDQGFSDSLEQLDLDGSNGFVINGIEMFSRTGASVSSAGDINGDGIDDLIIGANGVFPNGKAYAGASYVVFGSDQGFSDSLELSDLDGSNGFVINGIDANDASGFSVSGAGDLNGDGIDDLIIGAFEAAPNGNSYAGESYVVFGSGQGFSASLELSNLDGNNGFVLNGIDIGDSSGRSVSSAGDINGDGVDDLIIGAASADPNGNESAGESYVVFGRRSNGEAAPLVKGLPATGYINDQGVLVGSVFGAGAPYTGHLFSNTDGTANPDDVLQGTDGTDNIWSGTEGNDTIASGAGSDTIGFGDGNAWVAAGAKDDFVYAAGAGGGDNTINLGAGNDTFWAPAGNNDIISASGNNTIGIGTGNDTVTTGNGNDFVYSVNGGGGINIINLGAGNDTFWAQAGNNDITSISGNNTIGIGTGNDTVSTGDGNDFVYSVNGGGGINIINLGAGNDTLQAQAGDNIVTSIAGNNDIVTGTGQDTITTGAGNDFVKTGSGNDHLDLGTNAGGAADFDSAFGQGGNDTFVLNQGMGFLTVGDFTQGEDLLEIRGLTFGDLVTTSDLARNSTWVLTTGGDVLAELQGFTGTLMTTDVVEIPFGPVLNLADLDGSTGFVINGIDAYDGSGYSVSTAGDINGDGIDDLIIGARFDDPNGYSRVGESYVVFGSDQSFSDSLDLATLDGSNGFVLNGTDADNISIFSVSDAGDVNGDGIDDLIIGASFANPNGNYSAGESYVVFGSNQGFSDSLELSDLDGNNGFALNGIDGSDFSGGSVSAAGDINGDGIDDLIIGARFADPNGNSAAGESYVVFGSDQGFSASLELSALDGSNGFVINGIDADDFSGFSVSGAGDINGDGIDDLIIGAVSADPNGNYSAGESYVVFGSKQGFSASLELATLDGSNGFVINGIDTYDRSGRSASGAGDINGDGIDDLIVGAFGADLNSNYGAGESYVVFGSDQGFSASLELSDLDGSNGFVLKGIDGGDNSGLSVSGAGDINGDGIDDLIIGAPFADLNSNYSAGESYVVFGSDQGFSASLELSDLDGSNGFVINGIDANDLSGRSVSGAGDINGDGIDDLIIGATGADTNDNDDTGESYVVFGRRSNVDEARLVNGLLATGYVNEQGVLVGSVFGAGDPYTGTLFSNTDDTANPDDVLKGTDGRDNIRSGAEGNDTIASGAGRDRIGFGDGDAWVDAGAGNDFVYAAGAGGGTNIIDLGAGNDTFEARKGNNIVTSLSGNNKIRIGGGNDIVTLGDGDDNVQIFNSGGGLNTIDLGAGNDRFRARKGDNIVTSLSGNNTIRIGRGNDIVTLGDGDDNVQVFNSGGGINTIDLGAGNDKFRGRKGDNTVTSIAGNNTIFTATGKDIVTTGGGNDFVKTGSGNDRLDLGTNAGGATDFDIAFGQGGNDTFVLNEGTGFLQVADFAQGKDQLEISDLTFEDLGITTDIDRNSTWIATTGGDVLAELQGFTGTLMATDVVVV